MMMVRSISTSLSLPTLLMLLLDAPIIHVQSWSMRNPTSMITQNRRIFLTESTNSAACLTTASILLVIGAPLPYQDNRAEALVKGVPPPASLIKKDASETKQSPRCTNIEECQELAERRRDQEVMQELQEEKESYGQRVQVTKGGTRYRDLEAGAGELRVQQGDRVTMYFKTLKIGKRSYDGISGEGTVVFSRGYGLEDDESAPGIQSFTAVVGSPDNIVALNEALLDLPEGAIRRFAILPQQGWERPTRTCDGGPGGQGAGGSLKTDYVLVPTATMVATESCFDTTKQPFPTTFAEQRRMAQRFDQTLLMEVQIVKIER